MFACMCARVRVCVCVRVRMCVCVCVRERGRERDGTTHVDEDVHGTGRLLIGILLGGEW